MDVYVLKEGQRIGPFVPFKLREMLEDGEILPGDLGWLQEMETWAPLESIEPLAGWMPRKLNLPPPLPPPAERPGKPGVPAMGPAATAGDMTVISPGTSALAWRRWGARMVDSSLWFALVWSVGTGLGWLDLWDWFANPEKLLLCLIPPLLWLPVEATFLQQLGTTPGKWMLGLRVTDGIGQNLSWPAAMKRALLAHVTGNGLGLRLVAPLLLLPVMQWSMSWAFYRRNGTTLWDKAAGSQVGHQRIPVPGPIAIAGIMIGWMSVTLLLFIRAPLPPGLPEELRQSVENFRLQIKDMQRQLNDAAPPLRPPDSKPAVPSEPVPSRTA